MKNYILTTYKFIYYIRKVPFIPYVLDKIFLRILFSCQIGIGAKIGDDVTFGYAGLGVVIHHRAIIEENVSIGPHVVIGGTTKKHGVPTIGKNSILSTGSKILGPIRIGQNCVIGANAVVISDIPDFCLAVGVPARVVKTDISIDDYR